MNQATAVRRVVPAKPPAVTPDALPKVTAQLAARREPRQPTTSRFMAEGVAEAAQRRLLQRRRRGQESRNLCRLKRMSASNFAESLPVIDASGREPVLALANNLLWCRRRAFQRRPSWLIS